MILLIMISFIIICINRMKFIIVYGFMFIIIVEGFY